MNRRNSSQSPNVLASLFLGAAVGASVLYLFSQTQSGGSPNRGNRRAGATDSNLFKLKPIRRSSHLRLVASNGKVIASPNSMARPKLQLVHSSK